MRVRGDGPKRKSERSWDDAVSGLQFIGSREERGSNQENFQ